MFFRFISKEVEISNTRPSNLKPYIMHFPPRLMTTILESDVFMYPKLLPKIAFRVDKQKFSDFTPSED